MRTDSADDIEANIERITAASNRTSRQNLERTGIRFLMPVDAPEVPLLAKVHAESSEIRRERAYLDARKHRADRIAAMRAAQRDQESPPALAVVLPFRGRTR